MQPFERMHFLIQIQMMPPHIFDMGIAGFFLAKIHKGENINGEGAKRLSGGEGVEGGVSLPFRSAELLKI